MFLNNKSKQLSKMLLNDKFHISQLDWKQLRWLQFHQTFAPEICRTSTKNVAPLAPNDWRHNANTYASVGTPVPLIQFSNTLHGHCELDIVHTVCTEHMGVESTLLTPRPLSGMLIAYTALYIVYTVHTHGRQALTLNILVGDACLSLPL